MAFFTKRPSLTKGWLGDTESKPRPVQIRCEDGWIRAYLQGPADPVGYLLVAGWETGEQRLSGYFDLKEMHAAGFATLRLDLVRKSEKDYRLIRFDIPRLARRFCAAVAWLAEEPSLPSRPTGFLCGGNAAAAALWSTQKLGTRPKAIVSLNGRPHLAEPLVGNVSCPTLLIVSKGDPRLLHMTHLAAQRLNGSSQLVELDPAKQQLERVSGQAGQAARETASWFRKHFSEKSGSSQRLALSAFLAFYLKRMIIAFAAFTSALIALSEPQDQDAGEIADTTTLERHGSINPPPES